MFLAHRPPTGLTIVMMNSMKVNLNSFLLLLLPFRSWGKMHTGTHDHSNRNFITRPCSPAMQLRDRPLFVPPSKADFINRSKTISWAQSNFRTYFYSLLFKAQIDNNKHRKHDLIYDYQFFFPDSKLISNSVFVRIYIPCTHTHAGWMRACAPHIEYHSLCVHTVHAVHNEIGIVHIRHQQR